MIFKIKWFESIMMLVMPLLLMHNLTACNSPKSIPSDTLPHITKEYNGYRLVIADINIKKKKSKSVQLEYTLINTGREVIHYTKGTSAQPPIYFEFDHTLEEADMRSYKKDILSQILNKNITIRVGQSLKKQSLKLRLDPNRKNDNEDTFTLPASGGNSSEESYIDRNFCPDLRIDTILITRQTKKWVTLEFKISNYGKGPAALKGETSKDEDNLAIKAYLNRTAKLSKGSIPIGGTFIKDKELLKPGETYTGVVRLDNSKKTKFSSMLILELDAYQVIRECDETNNNKAVSLVQ